MLKIEKRNYSYTILLAVSIILTVGGWKTGVLANLSEVHGLELEVSADVEETANVLQIEENFSLTKARREIWKEENTSAQLESQGAPLKKTPTYEAEISYFDDALFIGDSRTVGLHEYGNLGNAEVIADTGMNVYKIFQREFELSSGENGKLEELLSIKQFRKIYIMLGVNELGYDYEKTVARYEDMVNRIQVLQPNAILFLQANLHITEEKAEESTIYNNENIERFNQAVAKMADGHTRYYLDANELFDDGQGNLAEQYTVDRAHVLGIYYADWVEWLLKHAVEIFDT